MHLIEVTPPVRASSYPADWPLPVLCNEAEPSSRDTTARALAFPSFNGQDRSHPLRGRLHDFRSFIMVNTFQFTSTTKLTWRFQEHTERNYDGDAEPVPKNRPVRNPFPALLPCLRCFPESAKQAWWFL